jgi:hypothetical protein
LGVDPLVLGIDDPFIRGDEYRHGSKYIGSIGLSAAEERAIRVTNAAALFGA